MPHAELFGMSVVCELIADPQVMFYIGTTRQAIHQEALEFLKCESGFLHQGGNRRYISPMSHLPRWFLTFI
jgi:hypothetical protein